MPYLDQINDGTDVQKLPISALPKVAEEIRKALIVQSSVRGSHLAPSLGVVELTIALYRVFDFKKDKLIFDVSHQSATHKILSGRKEFFLKPELINTLSEFTNPEESPYDLFKVGHTSTAVSLGCGLVIAREQLKEAYAVVSVVGDGALSGGEALEGLNLAGSLKSPFVIVVNDNEWSIGENQGGLYQNLTELRKSKGKAECNLFKSFGLEYVYVEEGHDIEALIFAFQEAKKKKRPIVVHVHTKKGKGYGPAEKDPEVWHSMKKPFDIETGLPKENKADESYLDIVPNALIQRAKANSKMVVINAGTPSSVGMFADRRAQMGEQFIDVGIAEEQVMSVASAVAKGGCRPVVCIYSSFMQRAFDQIMQDVATNKSPVVVLVYGGGLSKNDSTHQGTFDIPMINAIPNVMYWHPTTVEETIACLDMAVAQTEQTIFIRIPTEVYHGPIIEAGLPHFKIEKKGKEVAIVGLGDKAILAKAVCQKLELEGMKTSVINPFCSTPIDQALIDELKKYQVVITIENGSIQGGFGQKMAGVLSPYGIRVLNYGAACEFVSRQSVADQQVKYHLTVGQMADDIKNQLR